MHLCVGFVGISYDMQFAHRKIKILKVDATLLFENHKQHIFDDLKAHGHTYDVAIATNAHDMMETYVTPMSPVWVSTRGTSLHERERDLLEYVASAGYDGCILLRCDLVMKTILSRMSINYTKMNFPFRQVMFERWKELKFKRVPTYNLREVGGGFYYIPKRLYDIAIQAFAESIQTDNVHHMNDSFHPEDIHFILDERYQSNTDVMENPLFDFQRSVFDERVNPNMNDQYVARVRAAYPSIRNKQL